MANIQQMKARYTEFRWGSAVLWALILVSGAVTVLGAVSWAGWLVVSEAIDPAEISADGANRWVDYHVDTPLRRSGYFTTGCDDIAGTATGKQEAELSLSEDSKPLGPAHQSSSAISAGGNGAYSYQCTAPPFVRGLVFSTSDNSDPRTNGRHYHVRYPVGLEYSVFVLAISILIIAALCRAKIKTVKIVLAWAVGRRNRVVAFLKTASLPAAISLYELLFLPPTWNNTDSTSMIAIDLNYIPHFQPLVPQIIDIAEHLFGYSAPMIWSLLIIQHIVLVTAISYLAIAWSSWGIRILISLSASLGSNLHLYSQGLYTEALSLSFLIFMIGGCVRVARYGFSYRGPFFVYCLALILMTLTRESWAVLGGMLPVLVIVQRLLRGAGEPGYLIPAAVATLAIPGAILVCSAVQHAYPSCGKAYGDTVCRQQPGLFGVYRIQVIGARLEGAQRREWLERMQALMPDPAEKRAFVIMATNPRPWFGTYEEIKGDHPGADPAALTLMSRVYMVFLTHQDGYALRQFWDTLVTYFSGGGHYADITSQTAVWMDRYREIYKQSDFSEDFKNFIRDSSLFDPARYAGYVHLNILLSTLDMVAPIHIVLALALIWGFVMVTGRLKPVETAGLVVVISLALAAIVYATIASLATIYGSRYGAPVYLMAWIAAAVTVGSFAPEPPPGRRLCV